jgi:hypothetical protein
MAEAEGNRSTSGFRARKWMTLEDVIDRIAFRGQPFEPLPSQEPVKGNQNRGPQAWLRIYWRKWAEEKELMPAFQAGKLDLLCFPVNDLLVEPKPVPLIALQGIARLDQVIRKVRPDHWHITNLVFVSDEAQVQALWPAGKWLTLSEEDKRRFVEAYINAYPKIGTGILHTILPQVIRKQIPRIVFRSIVSEWRQNPRQKTG